jgi:hypothetical protein
MSQFPANAFITRYAKAAAFHVLPHIRRCPYCDVLLPSRRSVRYCHAASAIDALGCFRNTPQASCLSYRVVILLETSCNPSATDSDPRPK